MPSLITQQDTPSKYEGISQEELDIFKQANEMGLLDTDMSQVNNPIAVDNTPSRIPALQYGGQQTQEQIGQWNTQKPRPEESTPTTADEFYKQEPRNLYRSMEDTQQKVSELDTTMREKAPIIPDEIRANITGIYGGLQAMSNAGARATFNAADWATLGLTGAVENLVNVVKPDVTENKAVQKALDIVSGIGGIVRTPAIEGGKAIAKAGQAAEYGEKSFALKELLKSIPKNAWKNTLKVAPYTFASTGEDELKNLATGKEDFKEALKGRAIRGSAGALALGVLASGATAAVEIGRNAWKYTPKMAEKVLNKIIKIDEATQQAYGKAIDKVETKIDVTKEFDKMKRLIEDNPRLKGFGEGDPIIKSLLQQPKGSLKIKAELSARDIQDMLNRINKNTKGLYKKADKPVIEEMFSDITAKIKGKVNSKIGKASETYEKSQKTIDALKKVFGVQNNTIKELEKGSELINSAVSKGVMGMKEDRYLYEVVKNNFPKDLVSELGGYRTTAKMIKGLPLLTIRILQGYLVYKLGGKLMGASEDKAMTKRNFRGID